MSLAALAVRTVQIFAFSPGTDVYGNETEAWSGTAVEAAAWLYQLSSTEDDEGRNRLLGVWKLILADPTVVISGHDQVVDEYGRTFQVDGIPDVKWTPRGEHHIEVMLSVVEG